jgi:hypothetical protein
MTTTGLSYYLVSRFEELGRVVIAPALFFFDKYPNPNEAMYLILLAVFALFGLVNTFAISRYLVDNLFGKQLKEVSSRAKILFAVVFTILFGFLMSGAGLLLAEVLTGQRLLFILAIGLFFPPAGLFFGAFAFATIGLVLPIFWYALLINRYVKAAAPYRKMILNAAVVIFFVGSLAGLTAMVSELSWNQGGADGHHVHAIVKNTCLLDAQRVNCPQVLEDIGKVEPEFFQRAMDRNQVFYSYNAAQNQYVLLFRYSPREALLFSQLLKSPTQNGTLGDDFQVVEIETLGKDKVKNIPEFAKAFEYLPDWNKK